MWINTMIIKVSVCILSISKPSLTSMYTSESPCIW